MGVQTSITVQIDGKTHREFSSACTVESVAVRQKLNEHWWADIVLRQTQDSRFPAEECLGKDLVVIGLDQSGTQQTFFEGFVLQAELEYEPFGSYTIRIQGVTRTYRLDLSTRHAYYRKKTMKDIADQVNNGLTVAAGVIPLSTDDIAYSPRADSKRFFLGPNHPNPFNPQTTISFSLAASGFVRLGIYDVKGRLVTTLVSEVRSVGVQSTTWNGIDHRGTEVGSGIYFVRLESGGQVQTRKILLLK